MAQLRRAGIGAFRLPNEDYEPPAPAEPTSPPVRPPSTETPTQPMPAPAPAPAPIPSPSTPTPPPPPPIVRPPLPTIPYPSAPSLPSVPPAARTWLQDHPWVVPLGSSLLALVLGLTIGVSIGRRRARPAF